MENGVNEKIRAYCEKYKMNMDEFSITALDDGYVARDSHTSIMFDREGMASSLPMYKPYGNKTTHMLVKGYAYLLYIAIALIFIAIAIGSFMK